MRSLVASLVVVGALSFVGRAEAFCRTTTSSTPIDYNPAVSGCWTEGIPLHWSVSQVPYGVASKGSPLRHVTGSEATRIADLAFGAWKDAACTGGVPSIEGFDDGPIAKVPDASDCMTSQSCDPAAHDVIVFDDAAWPYDDPVNTIALTTVSYGVEDGRIFEAYTEVNSAEHDLTVEEPPPPGSGAYDLRAIFTHEAGHFLGLAHATETSSVMYAFYQPGKIALTPDDVNGICSIYPPSASSSGCSIASNETRAGGRVTDASLVVLLACCAARRSRRRCVRASAPSDR